jgi:putative membrane protein
LRLFLVIDEEVVEMKSIVIAAGVSLALAATPALARGKQASAKAGAKADEAFVKNAAGGGMAEVELGRLATQKASSEDVKKFGQRMVDDHGKANDELKSLAQSKNIALPAAIPAKEKALQDRLSKLSGAAFDRAYIQAMLSDHRKDVSEFRRESQSGKDSDVKSWAAKTLPTLEDHLKMAEQANKTAVGTSGSHTDTHPSAPTDAKPATPGPAGASSRPNPPNK